MVNKLIDKLWMTVETSSTAFKKKATLQKLRRSVSAWFVLNTAKRTEDGHLSRDEAIKILKAGPQVGDVKALALLDAATDFLKDNSDIDLDAIRVAEEAAGRKVMNGKPIFVGTSGVEVTEGKLETKDQAAQAGLERRIKEAKAIEFVFDYDKSFVAQAYASIEYGHTLLFTGPPGTGKTTLAKKLAAKPGYERPFHRVQLTEHSTDQTLLGARTIRRESIPTGDYARYLKAVRVLEEAQTVGEQEGIDAAVGLVDSMLTVVETENGKKKVPPVEEYVEIPKMVWQDGPVIQAMQEGVDKETGEVIPGARAAVLLIDEFDAAPASVLMTLQGVCETPLNGGRRELTLAEDGGRKIRAHPQFAIILTGNTFGKGDESGKFIRSPQDHAFLERVNMAFIFRRPDVKVVFAKAGTPDFVNKLATFARTVWAAMDDGRISITFGIRQLQDLVIALHLVGKFKEALLRAVLDKIGPKESDEWITVKQAADATFGADYKYTK